MTVENINVETAVKRVNGLIAQERDLSPALKASLEVLMLLVTILANRLGLNSKNSSKPPSSDPDMVKVISVDRNTLPQEDYRSVGFETRQVVDLNISKFITEWRAEILEDKKGKRYVAPFPRGFTRPVQYGIGVKTNAAYMSQYQLIPYNRIEDHFQD